MLVTLFLVFGLLGPLFYIADSWIPSQYVFDPKKLQDISQNAIKIHSNNTEALFAQITQDLKTEYGDAISGDWTKQDWFFNNAGGAMGNMVILHASISEYLIFFGTPLQTEGHSGVHMADDYFTILVGEQHTAYAHDLTAKVYYPGDQNHLKRGDSIQYAMPKACYALELAQGWIPAMLPFGFADSFSSTLDFGNLWKTVRLTAVHMGKQLLRGKI